MLLIAIPLNMKISGLFRSPARHVCPSRMPTEQAVRAQSELPEVRKIDFGFEGSGEPVLEKAVAARSI
jgi:hypothetical protein